MIDFLSKLAGIEKIFVDNLSKKDKIIAILKQLSGLELTQLSTKVRKDVKYNLILSNEILRKYPLTTFDDYEKINGTDLDEILKYLYNIYIALRKFSRSKQFYEKCYKQINNMQI